MKNLFMMSRSNVSVDFCDMYRTMSEKCLDMSEVYIRIYKRSGKGVTESMRGNMR